LLIQVGPYPPPIGGVSMHLARLKRHLDARGVPNRLWSLSATEDPGRGVHRVRLHRVPWRLVPRPGSVVHYHVPGIPAKARLARFHRTLLFAVRSVFTLHGDARPALEGPDAARMVSILSAFTVVVCVKTGDADFLRSRGVTARCVDICPFLPPTAEEDGEPGPVLADFLARHGQVLCANGSAITRRDGAELYGLDLCVELLGRLADRPDTGLVFYLAKDNDPAYVDGIRRRAAELGVEGRLLLNTEPAPFHPVIRRSALLLRPTNTDGDALSIREALACGVPVVASDVVDRPPGCHLFANRDLDSLEAAVRAVLADLPGERGRLAALPDASGLEPLLEVYRSLGVRGA